MLRELHIKNFSIIDDATVEFEEGFNVITGETGAGKSVIIDALCLALGERATGELVRGGKKEAVVEAFFDIPPKSLHPSTRRFLEDNGIDFDDGLILKRIISSQGRSRAYINGSLVNVQSLADTSRNIIDVHGQYEHQSLLSSENQMDLLDAYGGLVSEAEEVSKLYETQLVLVRQISELVQKEKERTQRLDMLRFQISEIDAAGLKPGEEEELTEDVKVLSNAGRLAELANQAYTSLYSSESSCITNLSNILKSLREIAGVDARAKDALKSVEDALPLLEETGYFLRDYRDDIDFSPERLESSQERLELIKGLRRKYGNNIQEIIDYKEKAVTELEELQHSEERLESLKSGLAEQKSRFTEKARLLSKKRKAAAKKIESKVEAELAELSMPGTDFSVRITWEKGDDTTDGLKATRRGIDKIEFLISPNVGEEPKPVSKIASGGELSRVMLALKGILAKGDKIPVLIFDEIDAGIGGMAAETVGQKLNELASARQIVSITHLPQIASYAGAHFKIEKKIEGEKTIVEINKIEKEERAEEVARMLSGKISEVSIKHAKEMLKKSGG
ncbi:MAG TPA: DNA repair protein RecN [Nitrospirae bacterium]|nr:DNA repair protein RecN [bacterium BMS3Abin06]HDH11373.1 DNA repair protein RecN [Nitrospirota bacterium]HDZ03362.1 DNA repair protein RecN [Nitrospirota bacterium]